MFRNFRVILLVITLVLVTAVVVFVSNQLPWLWSKSRVKNISLNATELLNTDYLNNTKPNMENFVNNSEENFEKDVNATETLPNDILLLIFTGRVTKWRMHTVMKTWLKHVDPQNFVVYTDEDNSGLPNAVNVGGAHEGHTMRTKVPNGFVDAWRRFKHKKWFYKIDDDTFVVWRNLVTKLNNYDWQIIQYIGHKMNIGGFIDCNGGAGYVFSREMMIQFMPHYHNCMVHECGRVAEDQCTAICVRKYFNGLCCTDDPGWNMWESDVKWRSPNCEEGCVSIHGVKGADVERLYQKLYVEWESRQMTTTTTNTTHSSSPNS
jgi:hypothetical protein